MRHTYVILREPKRPKDPRPVRSGHGSFAPRRMAEAAAGLAALEGDADGARRLAEAAAALRDAIGVPPPTTLRDWLRRRLAPPDRGALTEADYAALVPHSPIPAFSDGL